MNCAIIGSTKIAEVHAEQLIRNGIKEVTFISRSKIKGKKIIEKVKKKFSKNIFFSQSDLKYRNTLLSKFIIFYHSISRGVAQPKEMICLIEGLIDTKRVSQKHYYCKNNYSGVDFAVFLLTRQRKTDIYF